MFAFIIFNREIIYTFEVPDLKCLAFIIFACKNGADTAHSYNLFDKFLKSHVEANIEQEMKTKQFEVMRKVIRFYEAVIYVEESGRSYFKNFLLGIIQEFPVS
jgi:hypothetical protein